jgi:two-component system, OmpR family, response regulator VicR
MYNYHMDTSTKYQILLVESELELVEKVKATLEKEGYRITTADNGPSGEKAFLLEEPHLLIVDFNLSIFDGIELCRRIRKNSTVPILVLKSPETDSIRPIGLGIGADDCLSKPFDPEQLSARVKALIRRGYQYNKVVKPIVIGGPRLKLDIDKHQVILDGEAINLTKMEFSLLQKLVSNPGWVLDRHNLLEMVWGYSDADGEKTVTMHISNLRNKLNNGGTNLIHTVYGKGYKYQESE